MPLVPLIYNIMLKMGAGSGITAAIDLEGALDSKERLAGQGRVLPRLIGRLDSRPRLFGTLKTPD